MTHIPIEIWVIIIGVIISVLAFLLNRSLFKKMDEMSTELKKYAIEIQQFREMVLRDYVRKVELVTNSDAHEKLWMELNGVKQRVVCIETRLDMETESRT